MKKVLLLVLLTMTFLAACNTDKNNANETELKPLDVEINISPEKVNPDEEVKIDALVTYGDEKVEDADEVKFQIWEKGKEHEDEFINGDHIGDGTYSITKSFDHDGVFYVVAHVTARSMHNMPKEEMIVGDPEKVEDIEENVDNIDAEEHEHEHGSEDTGHDHHQTSITVDLKEQENISVNEETTLSVIIKQEDSLVSDATIRFEIWKDGEEQHIYIDAEETEPGNYAAQKYIFPEHGTYIVNVHVEKGDIHDHFEKTIVVSE